MKKIKKEPEEEVVVLYGYGEHATGGKVKKGEIVMVRYGYLMEAGLTPEEHRQRREDQMDDILYSKPVALVKKLKRRIKKDQ